ncbi:2-octaprenyl-6-methoxyphenyl hydroxylase [Hahella chejuensis]|nr:2-octaprenyl-6-methoxyphenyl hydroxylase [Hahella chejuensis]
MMTRHYDIVIVGGGLVGATLALALQQSSRRRFQVALVEAHSLQTSSEGPFTPSFDVRSTALSHGSRLLYERMGVWSAMAPYAGGISAIHVSEQGKWGATRLQAREQGLDAFGYVVPNAAIGRSLVASLEGWADLTVLTPAEAVSAESCPEGMRVSLREGERERDIVGRLLVLADGGRSSLAEGFGIASRHEDYGQHALVVNVSLSRSHDNIAYERFIDGGAVAFLPLASEGNDRMAVVWTVPSNRLQGLLSLNKAGFAEALQSQIGYRIGRIVQVGDINHYPLTLQTAQEQVREGLVLLGNSAHTLHPVAGQGYNLSLRDALHLAEALNEAVTNEELGGLSILNKYLARQQADQKRTVTASDGLIKLFGEKSVWLESIRQFGLISLNLAPAAKRRFAEYAMGVAERAPQWR